MREGEPGLANAGAELECVLFGEVVLAVHPTDGSGRFHDDRGQPFVCALGCAPTWTGQLI